MTPTIGTIYSRGLSLTPAIGMVIAAVLVDPGHMVVFSRGLSLTSAIEMVIAAVLVDPGHMIVFSRGLWLTLAISCSLQISEINLFAVAKINP